MENKIIIACPCWTCPMYDGWIGKEEPDCRNRCDKLKNWEKEVGLDAKHVKSTA